MEILSNPMTFPIFSLIIMTFINKSSNPIYLGGILMLFTINIIIMTAKLTKSSILSYITFLMMIGGLLIIFLYFLSMSPKSSILSLNLISIKSTLKLLITMSLIILILSSINLNSNINTMSEIAFSNNMPMSNNSPSSDDLFHIIYYSMSPSTLISIAYLFLTMIIVVKMCIHFNKPLRQMKKN
uniref:NADH dehydrogenase subunit 6 n=1 Tax=Orussus occidentalis TaxID=576952 RepID=C4NCF3_ORUOC|nr:NADH dehydrogenase subunit 6 [Orussus occidentalis]ACJ69704.1 NADH dehydrogenase subunit 6 [Orussus occidentalis]